GEHHRRASREVEREGRIRLPEIILVEDEILAQVAPLAEYEPADARVDQPELVTGHVDRPNLLEPEVPLRVRVEERPDEAAARRVDVERHLEPCTAFEVDQQVIDPADVVHVPG